MSDGNSELRDAIRAERFGKYIQRQASEGDEEKAQGKIGGLLNGWRDAMAGREGGVMSRHDGSELRGDELRVPRFAEDRRSTHTQDHPPEHVTVPNQADHAILMFHNLMSGLDSMVLNDNRDAMRLHLTAEFVIIRALIEAATTALWLLGPDDSDTRFALALSLRHDELKHSLNLAKTFARLSGTLAGGDYLAQEAYVGGQIDDLKTLAADRGLTATDVTRSVTPSIIAAEGGAYVPGLGGPLTYWYWSTASSLAHGEPANMATISDLKFIGVDHRDSPIGFVEPSAASIFLHLEAAHQLITKAHELWNRRAGESGRSS